jgi:secernin
MGSDMVVASRGATTHGHALFGANTHDTVGICPTFCLNRGREFASGETVCVGSLQIPQVKQTFTVLGCQPPNSWGYRHGLNEHCLAVGCADWHSKAPICEPGLLGTDLVRLVLERCHSARQAFDLLTSLISQHGQGGGPSGTGNRMDQIFLLADPNEAYVVEAAGRFWASIECHEIRAVSDVGLIRQDWHRIAPGSADAAIARMWWPDDGSKLDFSSSFTADSIGTNSALRRWGRATLLLEQQHGNLDLGFMRRVLADHYEGTRSEVNPLAPEGPTSICRHPRPGNPTTTSASFVAELTTGTTVLAWCTFGAPCAAVYLPIFLDGDMPPPDELLRLGREMQSLIRAMSIDPVRWNTLRTSFATLQGRFDQETEEFLPEAASLKLAADRTSLRRQTSLFMQNHLEQMEMELQRLRAEPRKMPTEVELIAE